MSPVLLQSICPVLLQHLIVHVLCCYSVTGSRLGQLETTTDIFAWPTWPLLPLHPRRRLLALLRAYPVLEINGDKLLRQPLTGLQFTLAHPIYPPDWRTTARLTIPTGVTGTHAVVVECVCVVTYFMSFWLHQDTFLQSTVRRGIDSANRSKLQPLPSLP